MDTEEAAALLEEKLDLPDWAGSVRVSEAGGREFILVEVDQAYLHSLLEVPKVFQSHPVMVVIRFRTTSH